ncbi:hypothetical protein LUX12_22395 [Streptomyces somaliensis]|uniref:hypothetical protein n=1 Tax=Streptomyces somaliensis TaxID=78355 RepID=UPI0020CCC833|nr:hypothetical protein [Streptomyces somaliensis]MCP9946937.1 hypothetical protein [Streptomyces somaliensis]
MPTSRTERPLRRITCTGLNSGQMRCTDAITLRNWAPCGPDRSILPLSGPVAVPAQRLPRPAWTGPGCGPPAGALRGRGEADTEDDAVYMGEADPFVCRRLRTLPRPASGPAPWGVGAVAGTGWRVPT